MLYTFFPSHRNKTVNITTKFMFNYYYLFHDKYLSTIKIHICHVEFAFTSDHYSTFLLLDMWRKGITPF